MNTPYKNGDVVQTSFGLGRIITTHPKSKIVTVQLLGPEPAPAHDIDIGQLMFAESYEVQTTEERIKNGTISEQS